MHLYLVAIAWVYVVLLMSLTETSFVAGVMTFFFYCVFPLSVLLYVMGTPLRKRKRQEEEKAKRLADAENDSQSPPAKVDSTEP
jgi:membrane protein implicated in regulation of membrane protease activity